MGTGPFLALVIELYLPPSTPGDEVARVAETSYRPLLRLLEENRRRAAVTIAFDPSLSLELLRHGEGGILHGLAALAESGSAELAAGSLNHALLPLIPRREVERQIRLGDEVMKETLGWAWRPQGLVSPALAYGRQVAEVAASRGLRWILLDEICLGNLGWAPLTKIHRARMGRELCFFFQSRDVSEWFVTDEPDRLRRRLAQELDGGYRVAVVPAEAFSEGSRALRNLQSLVHGSGPTPSVLSSLLTLFPDRQEVEPLPGSRRTSLQHQAMGIPFAPWSAPHNEVQAILWHLSSIGWTEAERLEREAPGTPERTRLRALVDEGLHSAPFRQASFDGEWDGRAVLTAGERLARAVEAGGDRVPEEVHRRSRDLLRRLQEAVSSYEA